MKFLSTLVAMAMLLISTTQANAENNPVQYPKDYRQWMHIKSMLIEPGHPLENPFQGLHHVYGNAQAVDGLKQGTFPDGSIFVFDLLQYKQEGHTIQEGDRKLIGVMQKDEKAFVSTGGWGFQAFPKNSQNERLVKDGGKGCFQCHTSEKEHDFVFTHLRK